MDSLSLNGYDAASTHNKTTHREEKRQNGNIKYDKRVFTLKKNLEEMKEQKDGKPLIVDIKGSKEPYPDLEGIDGDFIPLEVTFFNENPFAVIVTEISLLGEKGDKIIIGDYDPSCEVIAVNPPSMFDFDDIIIPPALGAGSALTIGIEGNTNIVDDNPVLLINRERFKTGLSQIDMVFTYQTTKDKGHEQKIEVTSQPIKIA